MDDYEKRVKKLQAQALANLRRELAEAEARDKRNYDRLRAEHQAFLLLLVETRLKRRLTQTELAAKAGISQPALARIEAGHINPGLNTLLKIAKALEANLMLE